MTPKEQAKQIIDRLPDNCTWDETMFAVFVWARCGKSLQQVREGKGIPHGEMRKSFEKWLRIPSWKPPIIE